MPDNQQTLIPAGRPERGLATPAQFDMQALMESAIEKGPEGVEVLERLVALDREVRAESRLTAFNAAMREFKRLCPVIAKNKDGAKMKGQGNKAMYRYADYDEIRRTIDPHLEACGFTVSFDTSSNDSGTLFTTTCRVEHEQGHVKSGSFTGPTVKQGGTSALQAFGGANTFGRRYALANALDLRISDDIDGEEMTQSLPVTAEEAMTLEAKAAEIGQALADSKGTDPEAVTVRLLAWASTDSFENFPSDKYGDALRMLAGIKV